MQPHRSNALDGAAAALKAGTRAWEWCGHMPLSWRSWSRQPQGRAPERRCIRAFRGTLGRPPYGFRRHALLILMTHTDTLA